MPIVQGVDSSPAQVPSSLGMTRTQIVNLVHEKTNYKGEKKSLQSWLSARIQKFCEDVGHVYWRKKHGYFTSVAGQSQYDMSDPDATNISDFSEFVADKDGNICLYVMDASDAAFLPLITDPSEQDILLEFAENGDPTGWFLLPPFTVALDHIPTQEKKYRFAYWATPAAVQDETSDAIPLVPPRFHYALVDGLTMDVLQYTVGTESDKYIAARNDYIESVRRAQVRDYALQQRSMAARDAIQST